MKRLLSIFLSAVLAISMVPAIALADTAPAKGATATGELLIAMHRKEALAATNFTVLLKGTNNSVSRTFTLAAQKNQDFSELFANNITDGSYELTIMAPKYLPYKQKLDFDGRCIHLDLYNYQSANDGIDSSSKLGVMPAGDMNGDGSINDADADLVKNAIEKNNTACDLSGDGKVDLDDVAFVVRNAGVSIAATPMHTISNAVLSSNTSVKQSSSTNIEGNANNLLSQNESAGSVSLKPKSGDISASNPVEISITANSNALPSSQGIVIAPPANSGENSDTMSEGTVLVEGLDESGKTVTYSIPVKANNTTKTVASVYSGAPLAAYVGEEASDESLSSQADSEAEPGTGSESDQDSSAHADGVAPDDVQQSNNSTSIESPEAAPVSNSDQPAASSSNDSTQIGAEADEPQAAAGVADSAAETRYAAQPNEVTVENDGSVVIDLGNRVAIKKVTIRVTATANQNNLAEIAKVEFLSDFAERIGEPQLSIPTITAVSNTNADGQGFKDITISWTPQTNVTGYEVSVSGSGYNKTALTSKTSHTFKGDSFNGTIKSFNTYDVKVRSVCGDWRSSWSTVVKHTATCTNKPPAPQYVSLSSQVERLKATWNCKFDAEWYTLYYKEKTAGGDYAKIGDITSSNYSLAGLLPGKYYQVYVVAHNRNGDSPKSLVAEARTLESNLTRMPKFDLLNSNDSNGMAVTGLTSITGKSNKEYKLITKNGTVNNSKATYEDWKAVLDNDPNTYLYIQDWDSGVNYENFRGPVIQLAQPTLVDTFRWSPSDKVSDPGYSDVRIRYKNHDKNGEWTTVNASLSTKYDTDKHKYYEAIAANPMNSDCFEIRLTTNNNSRNMSMQELRVYKYNPLDNDIAALFTDSMRTMVKPEVTVAQVQALMDRSNAVDPSTGELHPHNASQMTELNYAMDIVKNGAHEIEYTTVDNQITSKGEPASGFAQSLSDLQPMGYVAGEGDTLIVYVADENKKNNVSKGSAVSLNMVFTQMYPEVTAWQKSVSLRGGRNEITVPKVTSLSQEHGGSIYLQYTGNKGAADYKVRILGATKIPMLNVTDVDGTARSNVISAYVKELKTYCTTIKSNHEKNHDAGKNPNLKFGYGSGGTCILNYTDICLNNMMYSFPASSVNAALGASATDTVRKQKLEKAIEAMETQIDYFYQFKGLNKKAPATDNDRYPKLRLNIRYHRMFTGAFMYAAGKHIGIGGGSVGDAFSITPVKADESGKWIEGSMTGWGISHEIGHCINASAYQRVEVTNNVYAQLAKGASSGGETSAKFRANYDNVYKGVAAGNVCHTGDLKVQLAQYWQLHLAYDTKYHTYKKFDSIQEQQANLFYARLESYLRTRSKLPEGKEFIGNPSGDQLLMQAACAAADKNVLEYFEAWGYKPNASTKEYANKFNPETRKIQYVDDDARLWKLEGKSGMSAGTKVLASVSNAVNNRINGNTVKISFSNTNINPNAMLGYEIKRNGKIVGFVRSDKTSFDDVLTTENNKVFTYEVTGVDKLLNTTETVKLGEVKVCHDGAISKANWTATSTTATSKQDTVVEIKDKRQLEGEQGDDNTFDPDSGTVEGTTVPGANVISAAKNAIDNNANTIFCAEGGKDANRPNIVINLGGTKQVTALKYTPAKKSYTGGASDNIADNAMYKYRPFGYKIELSTDGTNWTTVKQGNLYRGSNMNDPSSWIPNEDVIVNNDSNVAEDKSITIYFSKADSDFMQTYDAGFVRFTATNMSTFASAEIDILGPTSDNVDLISSGYGNLSKLYRYGTGVGDVIPKDARVVYGEYKGDPAYNVVILKDQNGNVIDGQCIILATVPKNGKLGETSNGRWVFWMEDKVKEDSDHTKYNELQEFDAKVDKKEITSIKADLYRVENAQTLAGQRLTSNSLSLGLFDSNGAKKDVSWVTLTSSGSASSVSYGAASAAYTMRNEEGVDHNGIKVFDEAEIENSQANNEVALEEAAVSEQPVAQKVESASAVDGKYAAAPADEGTTVDLNRIESVESADAGKVVEMFGNSYDTLDIDQAELKPVGTGFAFKVNPSSIAIASEGVFSFNPALPANAKIDVKGLSGASSSNATYNGSYRDSKGKLHVFVVARSGVLANCVNSQTNLSFSGSISGLNEKSQGSAECIRDISGEYEEPVVTQVGSAAAVFAVDGTRGITSVKVSPEKYTYNKKTINPKLIVKCGSTTLKEGKDYKVSYTSAHKKVGSYKVVVTGIGAYTGKKTVSFLIVPKGTTLKSVKGAKRAMSVSFKKQAVEISAYAIRYSMKKNMKGAKTITVKKGKTSTKIKGLKSGKTYYVQIATLKKVGKTKCQSNWSKAKTAKVR